MIGSAVTRWLLQAGHEVILAGRNVAAGGSGLRLDFNAMPPVQALAERLRGVDVVINAVGIFQAQAQQSFDAVHVNGMGVLCDAAIAAGAARIVHLSALGAHAQAATGYFASKGRVEDRLRALPVTTVIVRPSLVFSPEGRSTRFFVRLATAALTPLPDGGLQPVQPIHVDDLAEAVGRLAVSASRSLTVEAVGPRALPLRDYLATLASAFGRRMRVVPVPVGMLAPILPLAARLSRGLLGPDALRMLAAGSVADPAGIGQVLGRVPRDPSAFLDAGSRAALGQALRQQHAVRWMRWSLAAMWLGTAWVSLWGYPRAASHALLARMGLHGDLADLALWSGALFDAALGLAMLVLPRRRRVYRAQFVLVAAYSVLITLWLPEFWLHPFGPLLKNLPILAMIAALLILDRDDGPDRR